MRVGGIHWGSNYVFDKNFIGTFTSVVGDRVGVELRRAWVAYKDEAIGKVRVGFLGWRGSFHDTLASSDYDFNVAGVDWVRTVAALNDLRLSAAALLLSDQAFANSNPTPNPGSRTAYPFALDADQPLWEKFAVGGSAYVLYDRGGYSYPTIGPYRWAWDLWLGVRAKWSNDLLPLAGFFLVNTGRRADFDPVGFRHTGWATWLEAGALKLGAAKLSGRFLYASGDGSPGDGKSQEFRTVAQSYRDNRRATDSDPASPTRRPALCPSSRLARLAPAHPPTPGSTAPRPIGRRRQVDPVDLALGQDLLSVGHSAVQTVAARVAFRSYRKPPASE